MRADIVAGAVFPDYELTDHTGKRRKLSDLQGPDPMILVLSRGGYCPRDRRQAESLVQLHHEMEVGYSRLVTISTDNMLTTNEYRTGVGAHWTPRFIMRRNVTMSAVFVGGLIALGSVHAQVPTGSIAGRIVDPTGAAIPGAQLVITNKETGLKRALATGAGGDYSAPALLAGVYEVTAEAPGFNRLARDATIEAGSTTIVNLNMQLGAPSETATVDAASPQIRYDTHEVGGVVTRPQIEGLPLNGRSFLELAKLEPGAQPPTRGSNNRTFVPALGQTMGNSGRGTRVTVDGGSIMAIGNGGSSMGLSQEVVQEFQISTVNFDLTTGLTDGASVNVVTRSGSNDLHGTALYFFRSHGNFIPFLTLPPRYSFGHDFQSVDLRLSRSFVFRERWRLSLIGDVFNLYNAANLSGYSGDLTSNAFGQPTSRVSKVFGSGGPRAFQFGARVNF